jgi:hypothetical protein
MGQLENSLGESRWHCALKLQINGNNHLAVVPWHCLLFISTRQYIDLGISQLDRKEDFIDCSGGIRRSLIPTIFHHHSHCPRFTSKGLSEETLNLGEWFPANQIFFFRFECF